MVKTTHNLFDPGEFRQIAAAVSAMMLRQTRKSQAAAAVFRVAVG